MAKEYENNAYTSNQSNTLGEVLIANDVIATIACVAATEIKGVAAMSGNITNEIIGRLGVKNISKGAKIDLEDGVVKVDLSLTMEYGFSIKSVTLAVQDRVRSAIEDMTGLKVAEVNIHIVGVNINKEK
jgi:uncharacterized alkaline shock family protein YloU